MFIWMGEILFRTKLAEDLFEGLAPWMQRLPGRLLHVNVVGCAIFAAVSGSSAATCATIGRISLPELKKRGYDDGMAIGTLAGSGTLGLLIPPSIIMIVYGAATDQSIARLFIAGIVPGIMLAVLFMGFVAAWALLNNDKMPAAEAPIPWRERINSIRRLIPVVLLILGVIGSIYGGLASATEAAVVGVALSLLLSWWTDQLSRETFFEALLAGSVTSCMIAAILAGAAFLTTAMGFTGIPRALAEWITTLGPLAVAALVRAHDLFHHSRLFSRRHLDGGADDVGHHAAGHRGGLRPDLVRNLHRAGRRNGTDHAAGGFNLFVLQGMTGRSIFAIGSYAFPLFLLMCVAVILLAVFPQLALWLPSTMLDVK